MNHTEDKLIFDKIKCGDEQAFEKLFTSFYKSLSNYAFQFVDEVETAEEVTQDIFVRLWEKREILEIESSIKNYLFRSVKNQCLNIIQHNKIRKLYSEKIKENSGQNLEFSQHFLEPDLAEKIEQAINSLPDKRKEVFRLSREDGLKYKEIAGKLHISVKTVEAQMGLALKYLREQLKEFGPNQIILFIF